MKPSDYYFHVCEFDGTTCAIVSSRSLWEEEQCMDDESIPEEMLPDGFSELCEAQFEYTGSVAEAREKLQAAGFIENTRMGMRT